MRLRGRATVDAIDAMNVGRVIRRKFATAINRDDIVGGSSIVPCPPIVPRRPRERPGHFLRDILYLYL